MLAVDAFLMLLAGLLVMWTLRIAKPLQLLWGLHKALGELRDCDMCLGFWVYSVIAALYPVEGGRGLLPGADILFDWLGTTLALAFAAMIVRAGWRTHFQTLVVEVNDADNDG